MVSTYEGLLGRLDIVGEDVPSGYGFGKVSSGLPNFLADVLRGVPDGLGPGPP